MMLPSKRKRETASKDQRQAGSSRVGEEADNDPPSSQVRRRRRSPQQEEEEEGPASASSSMTGRAASWKNVIPVGTTRTVDTGSMLPLSMQFMRPFWTMCCQECNTDNNFNMNSNVPIMSPSERRRQAYRSADSGPLEMEDTNNDAIIAAKPAATTTSALAGTSTTTPSNNGGV
eukprot:scaffold20692_cov78-Attheya_sp.AAC.1